MSDADELGNTRPTAPTSAQNHGTTGVPTLPEEATGRFEGAAKELGRGGMGRVLEVQDAALQRPVALKELLDRTDSGARFIREARLTAQLEHPGVVPVYELGQRRDGAPYYAMRKVQGGTLQTALDACGSLEERLSLLPHLLDVVQTIAYAHSRGVLHRDLKPANVMVGQFGETLVLDWGLARKKTEIDASSSAPAAPAGARPDQTQEGASIGTPAYMAPEQARGEPVDERADVWSLGVMLFELLTGRPLWDAETAVQMLMKVANDAPERVRSVEPRAPKAIAEIADKALSTSRDGRFASAVEMAAALEEALRTHQKTSAPWAIAIGAALLLGAALVVTLGRPQPVAPPVVSQDPAALRQAVAERAQAAWDEGDLATARSLAEKAATEPLARGVRALVDAAGLPEKLWSANNAAGCAQLAVVDGRVACATFGGVDFWSAEDGTELPRLSTGPSGWQHAVVALPNEKLFAVAGDDGTVRIVQPGNPPKDLDRLVGLDDSVRSLALSPDGTELVLGLRDGSVQRWTRPAIQPKPLFKLKGPVIAVAWSRDGLIAASASNTTRVVRANDPTPAVLEIDRPSQSLAFAASWPLYLTAGRDVMAVAPGVPARVFSGARHDISSLAVLGNRLLAASVDGAVQSWTLEGAPIGVTRTFDSGRLVIAAEPLRSGGAADFYATTGKSVQAWRWKRERFTQPPVELRGEPTAFTFTADGAWCAGLRDGSVACREPGRVPGTLKHAAPIVALAVAKKGEGWCSLTAAEDGSVAVLVPGAEPLMTLSRLERVPLAVAISPDASRAAVSWDDGTLVFFSLDYLKEIETVRDANALALAFSPDGRTFAAARADKRVVTYLAESGREIQKLEGADGRVRALAFSPDSLQVVAAGDDRRLTIWEALSARVQSTYTGPSASIGAVAWSKDGKQLAAMSDDGTVRQWKVGDARPTVEIRGHFGDARAVAFSDTGAILEAGTDGVPRALNTR